METTPLSFTQKARSARLGKIGIILEFESEKLNYTQADRTGEKSLSIPYESIPFDRPETLIVRNAQYRRPRIALYILLCALVFPIAASLHRSPAQIFVPFVLGIVLGIVYIIYRTSGEVKYTLFKTSDQVIRIIHDEQYDAIMRQLRECWVQRMRVLYAKIDPALPLDRQLQRLEWLKKRGIISEQEYDEALKLAKASASQLPEFKQDAMH